MVLYSIYQPYIEDFIAIFYKQVQPMEGIPIAMGWNIRPINSCTTPIIRITGDTVLSLIFPYLKSPTKRSVTIFASYNRDQCMYLGIPEGVEAITPRSSLQTLVKNTGRILAVAASMGYEEDLAYSDTKLELNFAFPESWMYLEKEVLKAHVGKFINTVVKILI